jgi:hypothetical protein
MAEKPNTMLPLPCGKTPPGSGNPGMKQHIVSFRLYFQTALEHAEDQFQIMSDAY